MSEARSPQDLLPGLSGPLAPIKARLSYGEEQRMVVPSAHFLNGDTLTAHIGSYARRFGCKPDRHLVSLWSQKYLATLIIPAMALAMIGGRAVNAAIESTSIIVDHDGEPVAMRVPSNFASADGESAPFLLVSTHLTPLVEALAAWSGLSQKVLWGNAAHYLEWIIKQFPGGSTRFALPVPMMDAIRYVEEDGACVRRRKICCLRDRVPGVEYCGSLCPDRKIRTKS